MALGGPSIHPGAITNLMPAHYSLRFDAQGNPVLHFEAPSPEEEQRLLKARRKQIADRAAADEKARNLFLSCLTGKQREQYEKTARFKVTGSARGRYMIDCTSTVYNVWRLRYTTVTARLCAAPRGAGSQYDIWLVQKLALESDEKAFVAIANVNQARFRT